MPKKIIYNPENPNGLEVELTAEEITARDNEHQEDLNWQQQRQADKTAKANLKASAKAKLMAGEALTEDEANTIVL